MSDDGLSAAAMLQDAVRRLEVKLDNVVARLTAIEKWQAAEEERERFGAATIGTLKSDIKEIKEGLSSITDRFRLLIALVFGGSLSVGGASGWIVERLTGG